jgi:predicted nucleic acid-binding protein
MIILDTNVLSALMRQVPDKSVVAWLDRQPRTSMTTSVTILEIRFGLRIMAGRKRRSALAQTFEVVLDTIGHRVAPFDLVAAQEAGDLMASRHKNGPAWRATRYDDRRYRARSTCGARNSQYNALRRCSSPARRSMDSVTWHCAIRNVPIGILNRVVCFP